MGNRPGIERMEVMKWQFGFDQRRSEMGNGECDWVKDVCGEMRSETVNDEYVWVNSGPLVVGVRNVTEIAEMSDETNNRLVVEGRNVMENEAT